MGRLSIGKMDTIIAETSKINEQNNRISVISEYLLQTPYGESTLIGSPEEDERLVINLEQVDCFTFIDYVQAMAMSCSFYKFKKNLGMIRYKQGKISYKTRNHFFTDWKFFNDWCINDVTEALAGGSIQRVTKNLNLKGDGTRFLPDIEPCEREILYLPREAITESVIKELRSGDYAGIYSELDGLDVSHVGIVIKKDGKTYLRHASSQGQYRRVVDELLGEYLQGKPGLVILRSKDQGHGAISKIPAISCLQPFFPSIRGS